MQDLIQKLKKEIAERNIKVDELAKLANVSSYLIYDIVRDKNASPPEKDIQRIMEALRHL